MKGVFKYAKEDDERRSGSVKSSSLGMPPCTPKKYSRRLKRLSLGMPPCIPFSINNHQFVLLHTIFYQFICYVLCLERLAFIFLVCFVLVLFAVHNKLDPSLHCLGEKHAPLPPQNTTQFSCLSFVECSVFIQLLSCLALVFMLILLRAFIQVAFGTLLSYHAYLVQRVSLLH